MRHFTTLLTSLALLACVDTTLETPKNHPANPSVHPAAPSKPPSVLNASFDPFAEYSEDTAGSPPSTGHDHTAHGAHSGHPPTRPGTPGSAASVQHDHASHVAPQGEGLEQAPSPTAPTYTCPMHPEIVRDRPGTCPSCGMKLVPKKLPKPAP